MLKAIDQLGFEQAAPIQAAAIPPLLEGKDVVGQSQTGSGKTAAFSVPAIEKVDVSQRATQVLILCPTRELAVQVSEEVHKLALYKRGLHALPVYGGQSYDRQLYGLRQGAHIVIGTPGRVMDHMRRGTLKLNALKMVVLDEVDVMLNMGFRDDIELILESTPKERQTVFFSATIPRPIQQLIEKFARDPQNVRIEQKALTVPTVEQVYYEVDRRYKIELLTRLIDLQDLKLGIIFCNTKRMVDELVEHLNAQGYSADRLHGDLTQAMRDRVMNKFRKSGLEFLVATDVAARGIDVDDVEVVFNYDLPYDGEDYVHRIGRTGRRGRAGRAISFASGRELFQIRNIERYTNTRIHRGKPPTAVEVEEARANVFLDRVRATLKSAEFKRSDHIVERLLEEGFDSTDVVSALIHLLQSDATPVAKAPAAREPSYDRGERPSFRDRRDDRREDRPPFRDRDARDDRGDRRERSYERPYDRRDDRPPGPPRSDARPERRAAPPARTPMLSVSSAARPVAPLSTGAAKPAAEPGATAPLPAATKPAEITATDKPVSVPAPAAAAAATSPAPETRAPKIVKPSTPAAPRMPGAAAKPASKPKVSRATPETHTRLWVGIGEEMGVTPIDIVNSIAGETGLPGKVVGTVDIRERHLFVDVVSEHANSIIAKLSRAQIKGRNVKAKVA